MYGINYQLIVYMLVVLICSRTKLLPSDLGLYTVPLSIYARKILSDMKGINVGGKHYNNLRYADDTALLAGNEKEHSQLTSKINEVGKQFGMKINIKKTKAMVVNNKQNSAKIKI